MAVYRFHLIKNGEILHKVDRHFDDEQDALAVAQMLAREQAVEIWLKDAFVARVKERG